MNKCRATPEQIGQSPIQQTDTEITELKNQAKEIQQRADKSIKELKEVVFMKPKQQKETKQPNPAVEKGLRYYLKEVIDGLPLVWKEGAITKMLNKTQDEPTEKLKNTLTITAKEQERITREEDINFINEAIEGLLNRQDIPKEQKRVLGYLAHTLIAFKIWKEKEVKQ